MKYWSLCGNAFDEGGFLGIVLIAALVLLVPVAAIIMSIVAINRTNAWQTHISELKADNANLARDVETLRKALARVASGGGTGPVGETRDQGPLSTDKSAEPAASEPAPADPATGDAEGFDAQPDLPQDEPRSAEDAAQAPTAGPGAQDGELVPGQLAAKGRDLESLIGGRWAAILGGLTTALGAVLLVRVTIEAGLLGPHARIAAAALFSLALFACGEWLRRRDRRLAMPVFPKADIPAILTGVGAVGAFATVYAAYALYGFVGPAGAFVLLAAVGLGAMALSAVHGPGLAALGVIGSYATPLLVSSDRPNLYALAAHVLVVTASALGIAVIRSWLWLAFAGIAGATLWTALAAITGGSSSGGAGLALLAGCALIYAMAFGYAQHERPGEPVDSPLDRPAIIAFSALAGAFLFQAAFNSALPLPAAGLLVSLVVAACAVAWPALAALAVPATIVALSGLAALDLTLDFYVGINTWNDVRAGLVPPDTTGYALNALLGAGPAALALLYGARRAGRDAPRMAGWLASGAGAIAFLGIVVAYLRVAPFETNRMFGAAALALAFGTAGLVELFSRLRPGDMKAPAPAAFAVTSVAALSFAFAVVLDSGWLPLAFALAAAGIVWVHGSRPFAVMPWLAVALGAIAAFSLGVDRAIYAADVGTTPIFNKLIILFALPAAALAGGGEILRRRGVGVASAILSALGMALAGLFVALEIRHWLNGGNIIAHNSGLAETATQALAALGFALGLQRVASLTGARIYANATLVAGAVGATIIALGLLLRYNPLLEGASVGEGLLFNLLLPAYLLTSIAAGAVALQARPIRPRWYVLGYASLSGLLLFAWVTLTIRHYYQPDIMTFWHSTSDAEFWTYSFAWLLLGVAILAAGHWLASLPLRAASGILIALTICKVFVFDLSALTGVLRALSFLGLGISLIAIGRFYQYMLRLHRAPGAADDEPA